MEKHKASYLSRRKKYSINVDKAMKEAIVELPEQYVLRSLLDTNDDESELWEFGSIKRYNVGEGRPIEYQYLDPFGQSVSKSSSDSDHPEVGLEAAIFRSISKNNRSLDAIAIKPAPWQDFQTQKKFFPDESSKLKTDVESIVADLHDKSRVPKAPFTTDESAPEKQDHTGSSGKRRLSREEDRKPEVEGETVEGNMTRKGRKTRWTGDDSQLKILGPIQLPSFMKDFATSDMDPEIQELKVELFELHRKLQRPELHDDCPDEADRSPSPEPVYDSLGNRKNTRQVRLREKLILKRQSIISRLIRKNSNFKPAADYKPSKLIKKLYIPEKQYPGYNFVGHIIGRRGSTQKRMEKETGAKILVRGKGYSRRTPSRMKASDKEDLHVRIEADNQDSLDAAVRMVENLLIPFDQGTKAHKQAQLVELGELNGKENKKYVQMLPDDGHLQFKSYIATQTSNPILSIQNQLNPKK